MGPGVWVAATTARTPDDAIDYLEGEFTPAVAWACERYQHLDPEHPVAGAWRVIGGSPRYQVVRWWCRWCRDVYHQAIRPGGVPGCECADCRDSPARRDRLGRPWSRPEE